MKKTIKCLVPLAAAGMALTMSPTAAFADHANGSYQTTLDSLNGSNGSGMATVSIEGDQATVKLSYTGLAEKFDGGPFPHVQHIHIGAQGVCPTPDMDANGDGVVSTPEGASAYGAVGTTLSLKGDTSANAATDVSVAPGGGSADYSRTFTMNDDTLDALSSGTGVVVVHGLDPATLSNEAANAKSELAPSLPLAATAPALCGALNGMPTGGVETGTGDTGVVENQALIGAGGGLLAVAAVAGFALRRRPTTQIDG